MALPEIKDLFKPKRFLAKSGADGSWWVLDREDPEFYQKCDTLDEAKEEMRKLNDPESDYYL